MQPFKYRLQLLLDTKLERKSQLQMSAAQIQKELTAEREELVALRRSERQVEEALAESRSRLLGSSSGTTGFAIQQHKNYLSGLAADLETARNSAFSQQLRVQEFERRLSDVKRQLAECLREVDVLAKHRERLEQRALRAAEAKEAAEHDEIGTIMFLQRGAHS